ncbi:MAG: hypothetical protein K8F25_14455, partial [Fimbriimonadaceae bacterium]|nr:hypothetical protein [Alphaproteobacteria bacterium]
MDILNSKFTLGIEEEYLLIDKETRDLASDPPEDLMKDCEKALGNQVTPEFLRCQIEVGTPICTSMADARRQLSHLRCTIAEISARYGLAPLAVSTHPFATWSAQHHAKKERYDT